MLLFVMTADCDDAARDMEHQLQRAIGHAATVHFLCAAVDPSPALVFYEGGDTRPLLTREGPEAVRTASADLAEAARIAKTRPSAEAEAKARDERIVQETEQMLASEKLDDFPPFFQMARTLARDAWAAARETARGAPLLLKADAAAARLAICQRCPSLRGDRCVECGCHMTLKAHIASMRCPLEKWPTQ